MKMIDKNTNDKENICKIALGNSKKIEFKFSIKHAEIKESDNYDPQNSLNKEAEALMNTVNKVKQESNCADAQIMYVKFNDGPVFDFICWIPGMTICKNIDQSSCISAINYDSIHFQNDFGADENLVNYHSVTISGYNGLANW